MKNLILLSLSLLSIITIKAQSLDGKVFMIENIADGKALAINGTNMGKNGSDVHSWPMSIRNHHQGWKFDASGDGSNMYYITSTSPDAGAAKYLEVGSGEVGQNGGLVHLWEHNGGSSSHYGANQVWEVIRNSDASYSILSAHATGKGNYAIELSSNDINRDHGKMQIWKNKGEVNQKWNFKPIESQHLDGRTFIIENLANRKALGVKGSDMGKDGSEVHSWPKSLQNHHQHWKFVASGDGDGMYYITSTSSDTQAAKYLEVGAGEVGTDNGLVHLWASNGGSSSKFGANQVWMVNRNDNGSYSIISAHAKGKGKYALTLDERTLGQDGGKMHIKNNSGAKNQSWNLISIN